MRDCYRAALELKLGLWTETEFEAVHNYSY